MSPHNAQGKVETGRVLQYHPAKTDLSAILAICEGEGANADKVRQVWKIAAQQSALPHLHTKLPESVQVAETCTDPTAHEPHEVFYVQFAPINFCDDGEAIRKWSRTPFEGARMCRVALKECSA